MLCLSLSVTLSLDATSNRLILPSSFSTSNDRRSFLPNSKPSIKPISATLTPSPTPPSNFQQQLYQPFRPPPSPLPSQFGSLDLSQRFEILANRLGLWYEYAPLISSLIREGFSPPSIEEATGISGVEQNCIVVATQVRDSLIQSNADPDIIAAFDNAGAQLLYEIRLLSATQRAAAARYIIENRLDRQRAQDLARAMKDFPRRRRDRGWESFDYTLPRDCLSFMYYRLSKEHRNSPEKRTAALEQALNVAETEKAKDTILQELQGRDAEKENKIDEIEKGIHVPVVRLKISEVAEANFVVVLPICRVEEKDREVLEAPFECRSEGEFGVVVAEKGWNRWVVLPSWEPVVLFGNRGIVVSFGDARVLPWKVNRFYKEEPILVVADREKKEVAADDGFSDSQW